jgi:hypothetical protein
MDKRYQVFVSSTYTDLVEERRGVMQALLTIDCIPAGMELFPAADESAWALIESVIRECDYYVLILGGRYGSTSKDNPLSFTEREYDLALKLNVPVLAFLHGDPGSIPQGKTDGKDAGREALDKFRAKVEGSHLVSHWANADDLKAKLLVSITRAKKTQPRIGWIRADEAADPQSLRDLERLRREVDLLRAELERSSRLPPANAGDFAFGDAQVPGIFLVECFKRAVPLGTRRGDGEYREAMERTLGMSWANVFCLLGPHTFSDAVENMVFGVLTTAIRNRIEVDPWYQERAWQNLQVPEHLMSVIKTQFLALGLWEMGQQPAAGGRLMWRLTPYGKEQLVRMLAVKRTANIEPSS